MKQITIKNERQDGSAILTIFIIIFLGFFCLVASGLSYGAVQTSGVAHVADMQASLVPASNGKSAQVIVTIDDQYGNPVAGATVAGAWSGLFKSSVSGTTGSNGQITFVSRSTSKSGIITFSVTGVSAAGYTYDSSQNVITQVSISTSDPVNQKPVANIAALPGAIGVVPLAVNFDGTGSYDLDGSIVSYQWDFGDGSTDNNATTSHTYTAVGTFTATLTVTDDKNATGTDTASVTVTSGVVKTLYVSNITLNTVPNKNQNSVNAAVTVKCVEDGTAVPGATVSVQWGGLFNYTEAGVTGNLGDVYFYSVSTRKSGYVIFTVTDITAPGYVYDPRYNNGTDASVYIP